METPKVVFWAKATESDFDDLPEESAVYVITVHTTAGTNVVIYTGQTDNIQRRSKEHWSKNEPNEKLKNIIAKYPSAMALFYAKVHGNSLDGHERFLFNHFEPQVQEKAPDVEPKELSLTNSFTKGKIKEEHFKK